MSGRAPCLTLILCKTRESNIVHCTDAAWWQKLVSTHVSSSLLLVCAIGYTPTPKVLMTMKVLVGLVRQAEQNLQLCLEATHKTLEKLGPFVFDIFVPSQICIISI